MNDLSQAWAKNRLNPSEANSGDTTARWCRFLQRNQTEISTLDWTAFRILSGDEAAWQDITVSMRRDTLKSQWKQLHQFEAIFFELSSLDKRRSYLALEEHLVNNPPALLRLSRYEPFLHLDSTISEPAITDSMQLVVWLARIAVSSPIRRHETLVSTLDTIAAEPIRWRGAAIKVLNQPKFSDIEPDIVKHIASMLPNEDLHNERMRSRRLKFQLRYGWEIVIHKVKSLSMSIPWIVLAGSSALLIFVFVEGKSNLRPKQTNGGPGIYPQAIAMDVEILHRQLEREKLLAEAMAEFENRLAETQDAKDTASESSREPYALPDETTKMNWRATAILDGTAGLDKIREELQNKLRLVRESGSQSEIEAQSVSLRYFESWRHLVGNYLVPAEASDKADRR